MCALFSFFPICAHACPQHRSLSVRLTDKPRPKVPNDQLVFGRTFADHMLEVPWQESTGWKAPVISAYHKLELEPSASVFHYATEVRHGAPRMPHTHLSSPFFPFLSSSAAL